MSNLRPDLKSPVTSCRKYDEQSSKDGHKTWKRHPELYMPDGTMVLCAQDVVFRVYPGLLAKHSDVFNGMTSLSDHLPSVVETYDGQPLVRLPDKAEDLAHFLEATMGINHFQANKPTKFTAAAAVLRLSSKYMVSQLRQQAIEHFRRIIPKDFHEIGKKQTNATVFGDDAPHPFELITLFRECQLMSFLPWAFYHACKEAGFQKLVEGDSRDGKPIRLSDDDQRVALLAWKALRVSVQEIRCDTILSCAPDCKGGCGDSVRLEWLKAGFYGSRSDALNQWGMFKLLATSRDDRARSLTTTGNNQDLSKIQPCSLCSKSWLKKELEARQAVWACLPSFFELPPWQLLVQD
ncbi:hypothetical protein BU17DRAFT_49985 [Hysterangium stoloniferum]|nr:hypothetical protein BU17DRAFT_49985 [Hysterangium stoloniferum]